MFRERKTGKVFRREFSRKFQSIASVGKRKLDQINAAAAISDLAAVPGNRYWVEPHAVNVEIVDYH